MAHPRREIRADLKARLVNATLAEDRVYATATPPVDLRSVLMERGPVIMVYVREEERRTEDYSVNGTAAAVRACLEVAIEGIVTGADADNKADDLAEQIEDLLESYALPSHPAAEVRLKHTQIDVTDAEETYIGGVFMTYEIKYFKSWRASQDDVDSWVNGGEAFIASTVVVDGVTGDASEFSGHGIEVDDV